MGPRTVDLETGLLCRPAARAATIRERRTPIRRRTPLRPRTSKKGTERARSTRQISDNRPRRALAKSRRAQVKARKAPVRQESIADPVTARPNQAQRRRSTLTDRRETTRPRAGRPDRGRDDSRRRAAHRRQARQGHVRRTRPARHAGQEEGTGEEKAPAKKEGTGEENRHGNRVSAAPPTPTKAGPRSRPQAFP